MTEQSIFLAALDIPDRDRRSAYLTQVCAGDEALLRQVESLLAAHDRSGEFLEQPAVEQMGRAPNADTVTADATSAPATDDDLTFLQPATRTGSLGRLGRYEVLEVLGRGGFGTVLRAFDDRLHRVVAIKVLAPQLAANGTARARFVREARSAAAVRDDHVVHVYEVTETDEPVPYLVMEYVAGQTLQQKLDRAGPLSVPEVLRIGAQIARGLAAAHATGLIHRDIKPANILLENGVERVKITDFGLARAADDASISHSGLVAGTPMYMSPEQARGEKVDHRADLFSLGSVLYAMLTGRPPFRATTTLAVLKRVAEDQPRPVREINPEVPEWLAAIVSRLHAKDPAARFQSAKDVADPLAKCQGELQSTGTVVDIGRAASRERPDDVLIGSLTRRRSPSRRRWLVGGLVVAAAALLTAVFAGDFLHLVFTDQGRVVVEDLSPEMEVTVLTDGVVRYDRSTRTEFELHHNDNVVLRFTAAGGGAEVFRKDFALPRGRTVRINAAKELAAVEERTRARVGNNLAEIARAMHDVPGVWAPLFNRTDLSGWQSLGKDPWVVKDGVLVGTGTDGYLRTDREDFGDFHLRAEVQLAAGTNSGVVFRGGPISAGPSGYEADVTLGAEPTRTGSLLKYPAKQWVLFEEKRELLKPDTWTRVDVIAVGKHLTVKVDGVTTADVADADHARGHIGLAVRGTPGTIRVRTIEVQPITPYIEDP